ncbi:MAG: S1C family serine protease [Acetobacteraceae bacterium]|nr:S1C family serine protease [Acetobacteraceae bacterium]
MSDNAPFPLPLQSLSAALSGLVAGVARSVVAIHSHRARSSGFVWRPGLIVTADEALAEEGEIAVTLPGGDKAAARLVGRDPATDIALLRVEAAGLEPAVLDTTAVKPGTLALAVGSQEGSPVAALGLVSLAGPPWRSLRGGEISARIELSLALRRQAEGGLALDAAGRGFGMAVFGPRRRVLVIPTATIERVATTLEAHGRIPRGYLGLGLQAVRLEGAGLGAMVMSVDPKGPGAAAGLLQGDIVVAWDGRPVESIQMLLRALGPESVGSIVTLSLQRAGRPAQARLTIGERPRP